MKLFKFIRKQLLRLPVIKKSVEDYRWRQEKQKDNELFAKCMVASGTIREVKEPRVVKGYKNSTQWGVIKL